jgi:hypothetical protein
LAAERTLAQENLDAGKSPSQIFAGTCNACHKSPRGLLKTVAPGSLSGFLRQHYTTGPAMAGVLANYLVSNGAADTRLGGASPKGAKEGAKEEARQDARPATPDQLDRWGRRQHPGGNQEAKPEPAAKPENGQVPSQAAVDGGPDGRKLSAKQGLSNRKPGAQEEPPKGEEPASGEAPKESSAREESKPEAPKPPDEGSSQSAKAEPGEAPVTRPDPVASAPSTPELVPSVPEEAPAPSSPSLSAVVGSEAPAVPLPSSPAPPPAVAAVGPPLPPVAPAGPPVPPISQ